MPGKDESAVSTSRSTDTNRQLLIRHSKHQQQTVTDSVPQEIELIDKMRLVKAKLSDFAFLVDVDASSTTTSDALSSRRNNKYQQQQAQPKYSKYSKVRSKYSILRSIHLSVEQRDVPISSSNNNKTIMESFDEASWRGGGESTSAAGVPLSSINLIFRQNDWHDEETMRVLHITFQPWYTSTAGMTRPSSPEPAHVDSYMRLINDCIGSSMVLKISDETTANIVRRVCNDSLVAARRRTVDALVLDIGAHFVWAIKKAIVDYLLKDREERERLGLKLVDKVCKEKN